MIPYMLVGKLAPNSSYLTRGLVNYVPVRSCFRAVPSQNGDIFVTSPPPPIVERLLPERFHSAITVVSCPELTKQKYLDNILQKLSICFDD